MQKHFNRYIEKWKLFCERGDKDYLQAPVGVELEVLTELVEHGLLYSAINSTRLVLSTIFIIKSAWHIWVSSVGDTVHEGSIQHETYEI